MSSLSLRPPAGEEAAAPAERADDAGKKKDEAAPSEVRGCGPRARGRAQSAKQPVDSSHNPRARRSSQADASAAPPARQADTQRAAKTAADEAATLARHNMLGGSMERVLEAMVDQKAAPGRRVADAKRCYFNSGAAAVLSGKRGVDLYTLLLRLHTAKVVGTAGCTSHTTFDSKMTKEHPQGLAKERELRHALFAFHMADDSPDKQLVLDSLAGGA